MIASKTDSGNRPEERAAVKKSVSDVRSSSPAGCADEAKVISVSQSGYKGMDAIRFMATIVVGLTLSTQLFAQPPHLPRTGKRLIYLYL